MTADAPDLVARLSSAMFAEVDWEEIAGDWQIDPYDLCDQLAGVAAVAALDNLFPRQLA
ncbi:hypothetical protein [Nocardioides aurantiacus]|uniref:Uncharacterized protein n=1 Tax=Nocardioides aurantiacus TaxID=86796 RepID=A0A3N2CWF6_9ACTN|nr:hypothetical protein [Nocardioides aurantiacus]ROR91796.1 hypothetical protein EDD33_2671 [Nocardioides aurantiacus]